MDPMDLGESSYRNAPRRANNIIDSPAFDAKAYYDQLITTASLTTLLKRENELLTGESSSFNDAYNRLIRSPVQRWGS
jgi:Vps51/Vps67